MCATVTGATFGKKPSTISPYDVVITARSRPSRASSLTVSGRGCLQWPHDKAQAPFMKSLFFLHCGVSCQQTGWMGTQGSCSAVALWCSIWAHEIGFGLLFTSPALAHVPQLLWSSSHARAAAIV